MAAPCANHGSEEKKSEMDIYKELGVQLYKQKESARPDKTATFMNPKMRINRELILLTLAAKVKGHNDDIITCLDAFSASGVQALQWKKYFGKKVKITANDIKPEAVNGIKANCALNGCNVQDYPEIDQSEAVIETSCKNANVLLHERSFQFIHLDPFGTSVSFLDAAFSNLPKNGILSVTSTDISAFLGICPQVTMRHYNGHVMKCEYQAELACRLIIASLVRAAARCHKGLEVLFAFAKDHFIVTAVKVLRGCKKVDVSVSQICRLLHCNLCEERAFVKETLLAEDNLYKNLSCSCYKTHPGKTASLLGPVWSGSIFSKEFVGEMQHSAADKPGMSLEVKSILGKMLEESNIGRADADGKLSTSRKRKHDLKRESDPKARKPDLDNSVGEDLISCTDHMNTKRTEKNLLGGEKEMNDISKTKSVNENISCVAPVDSQTEVHASSCSASRTVEMAEPVTGTESNDRTLNNASLSDGTTTVDSNHISCEQHKEIPFYFTVVKHCPNKGKWPRMKTVLEVLRAKDYQASLTVFHKHGVRTTANLQQFIQALKDCNQK